MAEMFYRIFKVSNGWVLDPYRPGDPYTVIREEIYVFKSSKKLAKFIKKLDELPILPTREEQMTTYASNKDGNSILVDAQEWEELQALVKRQRIIIEMFIKAAEPILDAFRYFRKAEPLRKAYEAAQDTTTMTGATEK